jgi:Flp pilus assembly protein TadG
MSQVKIAIKDRRSRGFILLTHAVMLFFTIGMVGLAVDAGTMYVIKGRLSSAVDAAALAAGRSLNLANTVSAATTAAQATATQFFNANFPNHYLGTGTVNLATPTFTQEQDSFGNPNGILDIAVSATVPAPTYFMQIFGVTTVTVSGSGTATRRGTVMILVLDTSVSMNTSTTPTSCQVMVAAAQNFITNFSPYDTIGVVQFGYTASVLYAPSTAWGSGNAASNAIGGILTQPGQCATNTNTTSGLWLAYEQIKSVGLPLAYNSIVLFTDGSPNGLTANFPVKLVNDTRFGPNASGSCSSTTSPCTNMVPLCTSAGSAGFAVGTLVQGAGQTPEGNTGGLELPINTSPSTAPSVTYPPGCSAATGNLTRQMIAYIPDFDYYGNSTHGVPATSTPPNCPGANCGVANVTLTSTGTTYYYDTRDFWVYQANNLCASPSGTSVTPCQNAKPNANIQFGGGVWASFPGLQVNVTGSNFFPTGSPYANYMRPDQPTTIVAASMNTAMSEAYWIRQDASGCGGAGGNGTVCGTLYHPVINTIYLLGNAGDAADHEFLPIMSNTQQIPALPYDDTAVYVPYANPAFQQHQEQGLYQVTASASQLTALFQNLASEVLRLSH